MPYPNPDRAPGTQGRHPVRHPERRAPAGAGFDRGDLYRQLPVHGGGRAPDRYHQAPRGGDPCSGRPADRSFTLHLPDVPDAGTHPPPSFKYTIKGRPEGEAAGKVLDPIIIVDKKPH